MKVKNNRPNTLHKMLPDGQLLIFEPGEVKEVSDSLGAELVREYYGFEALDAEDVKPKRAGRRKG